MTRPETPEDIPRLFQEAWNLRDASALAGLFADDADFVNVVGLWWRNRADIEQAHAYGLSTFFKQSNLSARKIEVRLLGGSVAIVHVRWRLTGQLDKDGTLLDDRYTVMAFVAELRGDAWIVVAAHNTDIVPGSETYVAREGTHQATDYRH